MRNVVWSSLDEAQRAALFAPLPVSVAAQEAAIEIVDTVRRAGDSAVFDYARRLDGYSGQDFRVSAQDIAGARDIANPADIDAILAAIAAVRKFHQTQGLSASEVETWPGISCQRRVDPLESVGLYVPAGSAPLVSTLIMLAVPAMLAGVGNIAVAVPPGPDGKINAAVLTAASLLGLENIFAVGGAQAIAAMAFGVAGLPRVAKIFGPGNAWVAAAKTHVSSLPGGPAIDLPAGPSEAMVICDDGANPAFVAADILAQAEHDPAARVSLVMLGGDFDVINSELQRQLASLPRKAIALEALENGVMIQAAGHDEAISIANQACPEHLILQVDDARQMAGRVRNAGAIFVGPWTPESMGDYAAGPNHTLPTGGAGRAWSGVTVEAFQRTTTIIEASADGALTIAPCVERLAELEGLQAHKQAMQVRRERGTA